MGDEMRDAALSIGEVASRAGLAPSAVRYYEGEGLIPPPARVAGRRVFDSSVLDRLAVIELAKRSGFTIAETVVLLDGFESDVPRGERLAELAAQKREELDRRIAEAEQMKVLLERITSCECPTLDDCGRGLREHRREMLDGAAG